MTITDLEFGTNLFVNREPAQPDDVVTIFDTSSLPASLAITADVDYRYPAFQIRVRSNDSQVAWALAEDIRNYLHGTYGEVINSTYYSLIECTSDPYLLDFDENNRIRLNINFEVQRRPS